MDGEAKRKKNKKKTELHPNESCSCVSAPTGRSARCDPGDGGIERAGKRDGINRKKNCGRDSSQFSARFSRRVGPGWLDGCELQAERLTHPG